MGPGNIATAALVAPMAMATAARVGIPLFLMAIMVGNGANAGSLSPFAPTGIIVNGLMARIGLPGFELQTYLYNLARARPGRVRRLLPVRRTEAVRGAAAWRSPTAADQPADADPAVRAAPLAHARRDRRADPERHRSSRSTSAWARFSASVVLVLSGAADDGEAIKRMPWRVIVMVCGVTVLIALLEKAQGIDLLVSLVARFATTDTVTGVVAFITGSSRSTAARRASCCRRFCRWCRAWRQQLGGATRSAIAIVDEHRRPSGGRLAALDDRRAVPRRRAGEESRALFNKLLAWGLSMSVVGALLCYLVF